MTIRILASDTLPYTPLSHAVCVSAGPWVFLNGLEATDGSQRLDSQVAGEPALPLHGLPRHRTDQQGSQRPQDRHVHLRGRRTPSH